jgi:16S rRNA (guanine527-N7)-methyltransferase
MKLQQFRETLRAGLEASPNVIGEVGLIPFVDACAAHFALVLKWNPTHNLTRVTDETGAAVLHYLDCTLPLLALRGTLPASPASFLDVGSGAGFPGLVAALLWPSARACLVEPARKRASFLTVAAGELGLPRVTILEPPASLSRLGHAAGAAPPPETSPLVLTRATFSAGQRSNLWPWVAPRGLLVAWATHHEVSTWSEEASTWLESTTISWRPYNLPAETSPKSTFAGGAMLRGTVNIHRR